ncbi:MAG: FMN-binding negative transcriptional regulator [Sphingomonadales bacterium]|nr:FMN-binding negative transcriptional regulator [Sphingomonadales bacterium]PIX64103.1 MAG: negative transcriptional regulator [Sphingomonadales bacterium CG_4_10_14_3_um_filter_58_15]NCO49078.1 FMN-binding negative transcriptional regulator [Sphingomonadales bacterium]NCO99433.1 FMN-binding negative transcriptional regulator [Sphingomonadales bacterium]NCP27085.1 FMN-binding negative transcriptional regulator [Sphingomonadales bacterium]
MHPNPAFRWPKSANDHHDADERAALEAMIAEIGFGMVFAETPDGPRVAHVPLFSTGDGALQFHLSRGNALTRHIATKTALCVINGPDAYISPDWYGLDDQVPTWNYLTLELEGKVRQMAREGLIGLLDDVTAQNEAKLLPKTLWHRAKMDASKFDKMVDAIVGFEMEILAWRPTAKLGQNKPAAARKQAAAALDATGRRAMAHMMQEFGEI